MNNRTPQVILSTFLVTILFVISCKKEQKVQNCYSEELHQQHKGDFCTEDCPGVIGCDGKAYCNECVAMRQGISVK